LRIEIGIGIKIKDRDRNKGWTNRPEIEEKDWDLGSGCIGIKITRLSIDLKIEKQDGD
jgi:hypothetical protein